MIVYPRNWQQVGQEVTVVDFEDALRHVLEQIDCTSLAFSGGLDSSLLLYYMCERAWERDKIDVFTIGKSDEHKDVIFAKSAVDCYRKEFSVEIDHHIYFPNPADVEGHIDEHLGDRAVELFYQFVGKHTSEIIAGDGVDEFMCGYYAHMKKPEDGIYYHYLRQLQQKQLIPLNLNSRSVRVCLPYLDEKIISLMSQIPLSEKVDDIARKKFMVAIAKGKVPDDIISRRKYGFCDALMENKGEAHVSN